MNVISKHKKFISVILIFVILTQIPGCVSTKTINSVTDIPVSEKYTYILHTPTINYQILNARISDGIISGNLINGKHTQKANKIYFYLQSDSILKLKPDMTLALPIDSISKIELKKPALGATLILSGGFIIVILLIIAVVSANAGLSGLND
jgi:hypothetical protein